MKIAGLALALAACFAAQTVSAETHRLAFSKAENIEIFIDHNGANWCSDALNLRAKYGGTPDQVALGNLLPKIGVLLSAQCPQATSLHWTSTDSAGRPLAQGTSTKAVSWALLSDVPVTPPVVQAPEAAGSTAQPQDNTPPAVAAASVPVEPTVPSVGSPAAPAAPAAPVAGESVAQAPVAPLASPSTAAPAATATPALAAAPVAPAPVRLKVAGWEPASRDKVLANTKILRTLKDQNGCEIVSSFDLDAATLAYVTLRTEGVSCDARGHASGKGKVLMERSDGAHLARTNDVWLSGGFVFTHAVAPMTLAFLSPDGRYAWFDLGNDGSRFQYLARASRGSFGSGLDGWRIDRIDVLTAQPEAFRNAADIKAAVDQTLRIVVERAMPRATGLSLAFSDNFEQGLVQNSNENMVYGIHASRTSSWRGDSFGEWRYDLQSGQNYLFRRDEIVAQRKREALRKQAYQEESNLRQYDRFVEQAKNNKAGVLDGMIRNLHYVPLQGDGYADLMDGRVSQVRLVIHVDGRKNNEAVLDWPYEMRIRNSDLKNGWYLAQGNLSLDKTRRDDKGLQMSILTVDEKVPPLACQKSGCVDLNDPLVAARMELGLPDWTPEHARAVIQQAEQR